jgi:hypothetical protein
MTEVYAKLCALNRQWDEGKFNILKGLRLLSEVVHGSDLLPHAVSIETLQLLAAAMHKNKRSFTEEVSSLRQTSLNQMNPGHLTQQSLTFVAPRGADIMDAGSIFSNLADLKQAPSSDINMEAPVFIETLTASERLLDQLILDESVTINSQIFKRTPCCKGRPGEGYVGCVLYQIDEVVNGSLGVFLSKCEVEEFRKSGSMPPNSEERVCLLCYNQMLTCRAALFGKQGVGQPLLQNETMLFQDTVNCNNGFFSKFMILPGAGGTFPQAPFLSFHPRQLRICLRGTSLHVDESSMWYRPEPADFQGGVAC